MESFEQIAARLRDTIQFTNDARELALKQSREVIRLSSRAIRSLHRQEFANADLLIQQTRALVRTVKSSLIEHGELYFAGYVHDSQKEYVEAEAMKAIVSGSALPTPESLGIEPAAYLNGMAEAGSESRRYVLDRLRAGEFEEADRILKVMDDIYFELITIDFPDAITGGLRRTTDAFRAVLERTRGDLTLTYQQRKLEDALRAAAPDA